MMSRYHRKEKKKGEPWNEETFSNNFFICLGAKLRKRIEDKAAKEGLERAAFVRKVMWDYTEGG